MSSTSFLDCSWTYFGRRRPGPWRYSVGWRRSGRCGAAANANAHVDAVDAVTTEEEDGLVGLIAHDLRLHQLDWASVDLDQTSTMFAKEAESLKLKQVPGDKLVGWKTEEAANGFTKQEIYKQRRKEENSDAHLAERIMKNKQFSVTSQADDEYDFDDGPSRKNRKKAGIDHKSTDNSNFSRRILTQQQRCLFCFDNPNRPRHLVISIANFSYLMLPQWKPVVTGHCCILPLQHESATRTVDDNVWDEIRNFKKCLIMMFGKQDKDVVFLETVMGLAQQRRHCLIECIPLPRDIAKEAPLYFKKAIDEAEDEWSQHNAKRLIDTSVKGLRASIPKGFPYFHVEFGLNRGFVHVIDDEDQFKSSFGLNVIRGMLGLPEEDMHRRRRQESNETQKQAVLSFVQDWEEFDWTKQLG